MEKEFLYKDEAYKIIGACFNVYNKLGHGFLEAVYQEALEYELNKQDISFSSQTELNIFYGEHKLKQKYFADIICYDKIILELKSCSKINDVHRAQTYNYLKATQLKVAYIINFSSPKELEFDRIIHS